MDTTRRTLRRITWTLAVAYTVALALIAFWPHPVDRDLGGSLARVLDWIAARGGPGWLRYSVVEFVSNIVLFVPVGLFVTVLAGARFWWAACVLGFALSLTIELGQYLFLPARYASVYDLVANTSGAILGAVLGLALHLVLHFRR